MLNRGFNSLLRSSLRIDKSVPLLVDAFAIQCPPVPNWCRCDFHFGQNCTSKEVGPIPALESPPAQKPPARVMPSLPDVKKPCRLAPPPRSAAGAVPSLVILTTNS